MGKSLVVDMLAKSGFPEANWRMLTDGAISPIFQQLGPLLIDLIPYAVIDVSEATSSEIVNWITHYDLPLHEFVNVYWCSERTCVVMCMADFWKHYDDLWYPSRDDIWITDSSETWVLELSHEEELSYFKLNQNS